MKKLIKDPEMYSLLGFLGLIIATPSENFYVNTILIPIFFLLLFIGLILTFKSCLNEKKVVKQGEKSTTDSSYKKPDISIWMALLAAFSSLLAIVASFVLLMFLDKGDMDMLRYFIIATSCIHGIIVIIAFIAFFKILADKKLNKD